MRSLYESILDADYADEASNDVLMTEIYDKLIKKDRFGGKGQNRIYKLDDDEITLLDDADMHALGDHTFTKLGIKSIDCNGYDAKLAHPDDVHLYKNVNTFNVYDWDDTLDKIDTSRIKPNVMSFTVRYGASSFRHLSGNVVLSNNGPRKLIFWSPTIPDRNSTFASRYPNFKCNCEEIVLRENDMLSNKLKDLAKKYGFVSAIVRRRRNLDDPTPIPDEEMNKLILLKNFPNLTTIRMGSTGGAVFEKLAHGGWNVEL